MLLFKWPPVYRCSTRYFHHCDKQAAFCSHHDFQMLGILEQEELYFSRAYFYGMYYERGPWEIASHQNAY